MVLTVTGTGHSGQIHKQKRMMGWRAGFRCTGEVRGDEGLRVCACACVFSGAASLADTLLLVNPAQCV